MTHPKALLNERLKDRGLDRPDFRTESSGPDHEPVFVSDVYIDGVYYGRGRAGTKRDAERLAAAEALERLDDPPPADEGGRGAGRATDGAPDGGRDDEGEDDGGYDDEDGYDDEPFEGPWPIFEDVLAASLTVANTRVDAGLSGDDAFDAVKDFALRLYKETLENLGEIVEEED